MTSERQRRTRGHKSASWYCSRRHRVVADDKTSSSIAAPRESPVPGTFQILTDCISATEGPNGIQTGWQRAGIFVLATHEESNEIHCTVDRNLRVVTGGNRANS